MKMFDRLPLTRSLTVQGLKHIPTSEHRKMCFCGRHYRYGGLSAIPPEQAIIPCWLITIATSHMVGAQSIERALHVTHTESVTQQGIPTVPVPF